MAFLSEVAAKKQMTPAATPMMTAGVGITNPEAGVIATKPATAPEAMPSTLGLPLTVHSMNIQATAGAAVADLRTGHRLGGDAEHTRLALDGPLHEHPGNGCRGCGDLRDGHRHARAPICGHRGTGIEPKPADPEERGAGQGQHQVVGRHGFFVVADALTQSERTSERGDP